MNKLIPPSYGEQASPAINLADLTKAFGDRTVVENLTLSVPRGQVFGFLGPNGAGKTTTIRMMLGLIKPTAGLVQLLGEDITDCAVLRRVGSLIETPTFYPHMTARDNLEIIARMRAVDTPGEVLRVADCVGLLDRLDDKTRDYSQGMRQKLAIGSCLLGNPELIVLDEPANGLDPLAARHVRQLIHSLAQEGKTVFMSSHLLDEVEMICDTVAIINDGHLVSRKTINEIAQDSAPVAIGVVQLDLAAQVATDFGLPYQIENDLLLVSVKPEDTGKLITSMVHYGVEVFHVARRRQSLEDHFISFYGEQR